MNSLDIATTIQVRIGEIVVEPTIGICKVEGIRRMVVDGQPCDFYMLQAPRTNASILVPKHKIAQRGVRKPMTKNDAKKILGLIQAPVQIARGTGKMQLGACREIMNSGDPTKVIKLVRDLCALGNDLNPREHELMEQARQLLINEIRYVIGSSEVDEALNNKQVEKAPENDDISNEADTIGPKLRRTSSKKHPRMTGHTYAPEYTRAQYYQIYNNFCERSFDHKLVAETLFDGDSPISKSEVEDSFENDATFDHDVNNEDGKKAKIERVITKSGKANITQLSNQLKLPQDRIHEIMEEFRRAFEEFG